MENNYLEEKFKDVPDDRGTLIIHSDFGKIGGFDVKFEFWTYSHYAGVSAIFLREEVQDITHQEIVELVKQECHTDLVTITTPGEKYLFATYAVKDHS